MRAVDTNVLVRTIVRDDPKQAVSADEYIEGGAWVSHLVLAETLWVLDAVYGLDRKRLAAAVEMLCSHRDLVLQEEDVVAAALGQFRATTRVTFSDCLIVAIARKAGHMPLGTFDRQLAKQPDTQLL
ncbi:MAG TPA: type II toxin-antitoxin system VapC family toxin [Terriglobales bacterium]|nr:type II toxin-antitoxin system VapC family toxin [Terriglobales bacterium]